MTEPKLNSLIGQRAALLSPGGQPDERDRLTENGYWPARAAKLLEAKAFSQVIALCRENLDEDGSVWSGRIIYALALYHSGQLEAAETQFHRVLSWDPDNLVVLKHLGDIRHAQNDQFGAMSHYQRVLEIDPDCRGLKTELDSRRQMTTRTISLKRTGEIELNKNSQTPPIRFYTETMGSLYLDQGHSRLAARVFRRLLESGDNPRWQEKLELAEKRQSTNRTSPKTNHE